MRKLLMIVVIAIVAITSISAQTTHDLWGMKLANDKKYDLEGTVEFTDNTITISYPNHKLVIELLELTDRWTKPSSTGGTSNFVEYDVRVTSTRFKDNDVIVTNERCNVAVHNGETMQILLRGDKSSKADNVEFLLNANIIGSGSDDLISANHNL